MSDADTLDMPPTTDEARFLKLTVIAIRRETPDIKTFVFRPEGAMPDYDAGQSMTLRLALDGERLFRTFSLASAPGSDALAMTIKAHAKGRATRWLHERLSVGDVIEGRRPRGFMEEARLIHAADGGTRAHFHIEHFGAVAPAAPAPIPDDAPATGFAITMGEKRFLARPDETLLEAATRQTIVIPCGCASGMCGTCRVSLVAGEVTMHHEGGISAEEEAQGFILACSSRPRSDVTIAL
jgi:ferredoxin-NADP reductase